jgi:phosphopantothenoylcysteine decarboxylase/phosphopantothenate--cysteine ligase
MAGDLENYEVILGVSGGIAAYKSAAIASALVQRGCGVSAVLTRGAQQFITPLTFQAITGRPVHTDMFELAPIAGAGNQPHIHLSERADLLLIAPATANLMARMANGLADELLPSLYLSGECPALIAPAMNNRMWEHPATQANAKILADRGVHRVGPEEGWLACRTSGRGRMSDPEAIVAAAVELLLSRPPRSGG